MPAFEWIKWYENGSPPNGTPHGDLTCNIIKNSQMLVMGGNFTYSSTICDIPEVQGQHNMNLGENDPTKQQWYGYLPNLTEYLVPPAVLEVTGGT